MRPRIAIARFLISAGHFLQHLPVLIMRPKDLQAFSRSTYSSPHIIHMFSEPSCVDSGLTDFESNLASRLCLPAKLLILGSGGGREAIALAKRGFEVIALDFCPEQLQALHRNAERHGVRIQSLLQEMSRLEVALASFDILWMSSIMYSCLPTANMRRRMVNRFALTLRPGGIFVCQFRYEPERINKTKKEILRKMLAWITLGNFSYEKGDMVWGDREFIHAFLSEGEVIAEVEPAGFEAINTQLLPNLNSGAILFKRSARTNA